MCWVRGGVVAVAIVPEVHESLHDWTITGKFSGTRRRKLSPNEHAKAKSKTQETHPASYQKTGGIRCHGLDVVWKSRIYRNVFQQTPAKDEAYRCHLILGIRNHSKGDCSRSRHYECKCSLQGRWQEPKLEWRICILRCRANG